MLEDLLSFPDIDFQCWNKAPRGPLVMQMIIQSLVVPFETVSSESRIQDQYLERSNPFVAGNWVGMHVLSSAQVVSGPAWNEVNHYGWVMNHDGWSLQNSVIFIPRCWMYFICWNRLFIQKQLARVSIILLLVIVLDLNSWSTLNGLPCDVVLSQGLHISVWDRPSVEFRACTGTSTQRPCREDNGKFQDWSHCEHRWDHHMSHNACSVWKELAKFTAHALDMASTQLWFLRQIIIKMTAINRWR